MPMREGQTLKWQFCLDPEVEQSLEIMAVTSVKASEKQLFA